MSHEPDDEYLQGGAIPITTLEQIAERLRTIPKVADCFVGLEQKDFKRRPALSVDQILAQPGAVATVETAIDELLLSGQPA